MLEAAANFYRTHRAELQRFGRFGLVGASGAIVDFALLNLFRGVLGWPLLIANTLSVCVAMLNNFTWNRLWTFPESRQRRKRSQLPKFVTVSLVGLLLNNLLVVVGNGLLEPRLGEPWSYNLAKVAAIGLVLFWNFGANRLWTYRGL